MSIKLSFPSRFTDVGYVLRVVVEVDAVILMAGGVAVVVAAHGQVASPSLRAKRLHSTDFCGCLLSLCKTRHMLLPWMCMYGQSRMLCYLALETSTYPGTLLFPAEFKQNPTSNTGSSSLGL